MRLALVITLESMDSYEVPRCGDDLVDEPLAWQYDLILELMVAWKDHGCKLYVEHWPQHGDNRSPDRRRKRRTAWMATMKHVVRIDDS